jgi:hypothetical protein
MYRTLYISYGPQYIGHTAYRLFSPSEESLRHTKSQLRKKHKRPGARHSIISLHFEDYYRETQQLVHLIDSSI